MDVPSSIFRQIRAMLKPDQATSHHLTHHMHFFQTEKSERPPRGQQLARAAQPVPGAAGPERSPREAPAITGHACRQQTSRLDSSELVCHKRNSLRHRAQDQELRRGSLTHGDRRRLPGGRPNGRWPRRGAELPAELASNEVPGT